MYALKRLLLAAGLIAAATAVLLVSDPPRRRQGGEEEAGGGEAAVGARTSQPGTAGVARMSFLAYNESPFTESCLRGFFDELGRLGVKPGRDLDVRVSNAQGDMATLLTIVEAAVAEQPDAILTTSTPTLQATIRKTAQIPILFSVVADPMLAGAGRSFEDHLPNVTGISTQSDYERMAEVLPRYMPGVERVGTLFASSEANALFEKDALAAVLAKRRIELVAVPVATSAEVPTAAEALASMDVEAICQILDNLTAVSFPAISVAARKRHKPLLGFSATQAEEEGAAIAVSRDYVQAGRDLASLAVRVMHGEKPASIPIRLVSRTLLVINSANAAASGLAVPASLLAEADKVIGP